MKFVFLRTCFCLFCAAFFTRAVASEDALRALVIPVWVNGEMAVLDENTEFLIPFENDYNGVIAGDYQDTFWLNADGVWSLVSRKNGVILPDFSETMGTLSSGTFWFEQNGKYGIVDAHGNVLYPARFEELYTSLHEEFLFYGSKGKYGILHVSTKDREAEGKTMTPAHYDDIASDVRVRDHGGLVLAQRGRDSWVIDLNARTEQKVPYTKFSGVMRSGYIVVATEARRDKKGREIAPERHGLADAQGKLVIPLQYAWLGEPSEGRIAFRAKKNGPCGYLDFSGKEVLKAQFASCQAFGRKGALVSREGSDLKGKYGLIDSAGNWIMAPKYDYAYDRDEFPLGGLPGVSFVAVESSTLTVPIGIFDTNRGEEIVPRQHFRLSILNEKLLTFVPYGAPLTTIWLLDVPTHESAMGVMDWSGKVLIAPSDFNLFTLDASGKAIRASSNGIFKGGLQAIYSLEGKELARFGAAAPSDGQSWQDVRIDLEADLILINQHTKDEEDNER
ncbi:MAG: WG repeat-containing protein, partial [Zoogloeaceae bacterium]|nr:WG repeat-containing protein [Zoogloeaceae bacterium]